LAEDLAADAALRRRHCSFFATNLERWDRQLRGARQLAAVAQFDRDSANVSLAWQFAVENKQIAAIDMAADGLGRLYLWRRRFHEGEVAFDLAEQCLSHALAANPATGSEIKRIMAKICTWRSIYSEQSVAKELVKQVLQLLESPDLANSGILLEQAFALRRSGDLALSHDREQSRRHYKRSLAIYRELGDGWGAAKVLTALGWEAAHRGETERARLLGDEALALFDLAGDRKGIADSLWLLGTLAILEERVEKSTRLLEQSLEIRGTLGDRITDIAAGPLDLGMTLTWIGRMEAADAVREETLALYETQGKPAQIALAHVYLANSKFHIGQFAASEYHARIGLELCNRVGDKRGAGLALWILAVQSMVNQEVELTRSRLLESRECFQQIDSAPEIGWVYALLAKAALEVGQETEAKRYMVIALENVHGILGIITVLGCLVAYIHLLDVSGRLELGLEMVELMEKHPLARKSIGFEKVYGHHLSRFTQSLSQEAIANARRRGRARDLRATAEAIKAELKQSVTS
jgi:tetratricopeptide (TPR) repeat protein